VYGTDTESGLTVNPTEDYLAVRRLVDSYAFAIDKRDANALTDLFTFDAHLTSYRPGVTRPAFDLCGPTEIATLLHRLARYSLTFHLTGNHVAELDGDHGTGETYCLAHHFGQDEDGQFSRVAPVVYLDNYLRTSTGWKFQQRTIKRQWLERRQAT
jgi:hypothetical protein